MEIGQDLKWRSATRKVAILDTISHGVGWIAFTILVISGIYAWVVLEAMKEPTPGQDDQSSDRTTLNVYQVLLVTIVVVSGIVVGLGTVAAQGLLDATSKEYDVLKAYQHASFWVYMCLPFLAFRFIQLAAHGLLYLRILGAAIRIWAAYIVLKFRMALKQKIEDAEKVAPHLNFKYFLNVLFNFGDLFEIFEEIFSE